MMPMLSRLIFLLLRRSGLPFLLRTFYQRNRITILLFHDISPQAADRAFRFLNRAYNIIPLDQLVEAQRSGDSLPKRALVITFDDGHKGNYDLLPIVQNLEVPITIFLCAGIVGTKRHFWWMHDNVNPGELDDLRNVPNKLRLEKLAELGFTQESEFQSRQALSIAEIEQMKASVDFQAHTLFHPILSRCTDSEAKRELVDSKTKLEDLLGKQITSLSYPSGYYTQRDIEICRSAGYRAGITVDPGSNQHEEDPFRLKRLSVNDSENLDEIIVKASGLWAFIRMALTSWPNYGYSENPLTEE